MKAYNITAKEREFRWGKMEILVLGEKGRGRNETILPCPPGIQNGDLVSLAKTRAGNPKIVRGGSQEGWLARIMCEGAYIRGASGWCKYPETVECIATGQGAYGAAGRVGGWTDYLLSIPDGTAIRVKKTRYTAFWMFFTTENVFPVEDGELDIFFETFPELQEKTKWLR